MTEQQIQNTSQGEGRKNERESPKTESEQIQEYLNQFQYLKVDIEGLIHTKNPFSLILGLNRIFSKLNLYIRQIADFINDSFEGIDEINPKNHGFLYDIGLGYDYFQNWYRDYFMKLKYFDPEKYFEIYSRFDGEFKPYTQILIKHLVNHDDLTDSFERCSQAKYHREFAKLLRKIGDYSDFKDRIKLEKLSGYSPESAFYNNVISYYLKKNITQKEKEEFLGTLFEIFPLSKFLKKDLKYDKFINIQNLISMAEINEYKRSVIENIPQKNKIDTHINNYIFSYSTRVQVSIIIDSCEDSKTRGYLWGYMKYSIKNKYFNLSKEGFAVFTQNKIQGKQDWIQKQFHPKVDTLNPQSQAFLQTLNDYKDLIVKLEDSFIADLIKGPIMHYLSENLSVKDEKLHLIKFLLYFSLSFSYREYEKVYQFFYEYDVFEKNETWGKMKIYAFGTFVLILMLLGIMYWCSIIFTVGLMLMYLGYSQKHTNEIASKVYIRWHWGSKIIGLSIVMICLFYALDFQIKVGNLTLNRDTLISKEVENIILYRLGK